MKCQNCKQIIKGKSCYLKTERLCQKCYHKKRNNNVRMNTQQYIKDVLRWV